MDYISETYLDGIKIENATNYFNEVVDAVFPEEKEVYKRRATSMLRDVMMRYSGTQKRIAHIAVTHKHSVARFAKNVNI